MKKVLTRFQSFWLEDLSFAVLLAMLLSVVFIIPIVMHRSTHGVALFNLILLSVFFSGIFSTRNRWLASISASLFAVHCALRLVRFAENPYSFYVEENIIAILNTLVFIVINFNLLFRNESVNTYRIIGAINIYLLLALMGALSFEVINALTGTSIAGNINLKGTDEDYVHFIYFSLVSLTTVGFGDVFPVSMETKIMSVFLSAIGVLFPAIVISRLVGMSYTQKK